MYRDTEPSWRRERRGSIDRNARPTSMFGMESGYGADPRKSRDLGPPPSTRGFDKLNDKLNGGGVGRTGSHRERNRSSSRERSSAYFSDAEYGVPPRSATARPTVHQDRDYRDPYYEDRTGRPHTARYEDQDVASRGFGIRSGSIDRHGTRGSDESLDRAPLYPPGPIAPQPDMRDYVPAPPPSAHPSLRDERRDRDRRDRDYVDRDSDRDRDRDRRRDDRDHKMSGALPVAAAAAAAAGAAAYGNRDGDREREREPRERRYEDYPDNRGYPKKAPNEVAEPPRERRYETEKDRRDEREKDARKEPAAPLDPEEDYRRRVQQEMERSAQREVRDRDSDSDRERRRRDRDRERERERDRARDGPRERSSREEVPNLPPRPADRRDDRRESVFGGALVQEPGEMPDSDGSSGDKKVKIVDPPRESPPPPKGILKQPTQKFPEDPNPIREGVAPLKDAKKGKDIPTDARWTKIDRRLVNPEALEEAKERFEERMDCVIVLRVLKKEEIQKLADRTKEIREARGKHAFSSVCDFGTFGCFGSSPKLAADPYTYRDVNPETAANTVANEGLGRRPSRLQMATQFGRPHSSDGVRSSSRQGSQHCPHDDGEGNAATRPEFDAVQKRRHTSMPLPSKQASASLSTSSKHHFHWSSFAADVVSDIMELTASQDYDRDRRDRRRDRERDREHDRDYRDKDRDRDDRRRHRRDYDTSGDSYSDDDDYRERRPRAIEPPPPTTGAVPIAGGVEANAGGSYPAH